jgi:hypothetical protein
MSVSVAFGNLRQACIRRGLHVELRLFDGGQSIHVVERSTGRKVFEWSSEWGDRSPVDEAAEWLIENQMINAVDLEG